MVFGQMAKEGHKNSMPLELKFTPTQARNMKEVEQKCPFKTVHYSRKFGFIYLKADMTFFFILDSFDRIMVQKS